MTKKIILQLAVLGVVVFGFASALAIRGICSIDFICDRPHDDSLSFLFFPTIPLFIFSLITYKMKDQVFQSWWKFARVRILVSMLPILISPSYSYALMFPLEKGVVALFFSAIFVGISTILIVYQSFSLRKK